MHPAFRQTRRYSYKEEEVSAAISTGHEQFTYGKALSGGAHTVNAVNDISFTLRPGEVLGLVGESGSGKTTIAKMIAGFTPPDSGTIYYGGKELQKIHPRLRMRTVQMIFQDPFASINPKLSVGFQLAEALRQGNWELPMGTIQITKKIAYYLDLVGLSHKVMDEYPHRFSGGELQRIIIARALAMQPKILIADEPVSSLDLSIQALLLNLLKDLKEKFDLSYLFITHDLAVLSYIADRVLVLKDGAIVETGDVGHLLTSPAHEYTSRLLESVPRIPLS
jgi:ABC-type glutathione transport system ATPase component